MSDPVTHASSDPGQPTIIVTDGGRRGGSGGTWFIAIVLLIALVAGIFIFSQTSGSENAKDNAIANAAGQVGNAAEKVGTAAESAAGTLNEKPAN